MQVIFSTSGIFDIEKPDKYLGYISNAGFSGIMLDMGMLCSKAALEDFGKEKGKVGQGGMDAQRIREQFRRIVEQGERNSLSVLCMRMPRLMWNTKRTDLNGLLLRIGQECISACRGIDCRTLIVQPLFAGIAKENLWRENYGYCLKLGGLAKENGVCILVENQCYNRNGHAFRNLFMEPYTAAEFVDSLNGELGGEVFGICLDTGFCSLCGQNMGELTVALGDRLRAVLARECDGVRETARLPFTGADGQGEASDWLSLIRGLRKIEFDGLFMLDISDTLRGFSPLLRPSLYSIAKSVADYFVWQIELEKRLQKFSKRVLFGAGRMCRNYMECYGRQYPPLFVCDNNPKLWGTSVCGLAVKPPEALMELGGDCAVIICNTFYREISGQLSGMGVRNIETFSDECLPTLSMQMN